MSFHRSFLSSSGTRLTNEFRYLLDMINIVLRVGLVPRRGLLRRVTASGSRLGRQADRAAARLLTPAPAGASWWWRGRPFGVGERAVLLGPVAAGSGAPGAMWPVARQLHRTGHDRRLGRLLAAPAVADPVKSWCRRTRHTRRSPPLGSQRHPVGSAPGPAAALPQPNLLLLAGVGFAALHMLSDQHVTVEDPHQMLRGHGLNRFPGQPIGTR